MTHRFVDCQGLGGHWTLGTVQAGFDLVHRTSLTGGFGDELIDANRHLVGDNWSQDPMGSAEEWTPVKDVAYLAGTPPCSGFSLLNNSAAAARKRGEDVPATARGKDSSINDCMKALIAYAARCAGTDGGRGPEVVAFESVQQAYSTGGELMTWLLYDLRRRTGQDYKLTHVKMSGSTVGAAQFRHRYYPVFHRIPFGVERPDPHHVATYQDAIGDMLGLDWETWDEQETQIAPSNWLYEQGMNRTDGIIDSHMMAENNRIKIIMEHLYPLWQPGEDLTPPLARYMHARLAEGKTGDDALPPGCGRWWDFDAESPSRKLDVSVPGNRRGFSGARRIYGDRPGYVLTGGGIFDFIHWSEPRFLTVRECARLMGLPDAWRFKDVAKGVNQASMWIGKCCPVQSGKWISSWVKAALDGNPGTDVRADVVSCDENQFFHDNTNDYKRWDREVSNYTGK